MPKPIIISIPQPCHEQWDEMTPVERGRFCASCQKTVTDYTCMTDADILKTMQAAPGGLCGRFFNTQLGRPLKPEVRPSPFKTMLNKAAGLFLMLQVAGETSEAQEQKQDTITVVPVDSVNSAKEPDTIHTPKAKKKKETLVRWDSASSMTLGACSPVDISPVVYYGRDNMPQLTIDGPRVSVMKRLKNYWMGKQY